MSSGNSDKSAGPEMLCLVCGGHFSSVGRCPKDGAPLVVINQDSLIEKALSSNYEILETIGRGGMSVVYKAKHKLMKRIVALKVLTANDPHSLKRFHLEAQLAANLSHPNIVTVYDFGSAGETRPYLSMDFVEGRTLSEAINSDGAMGYRKALPLLIQACEALAYAHANGVIHRDLKPSNFMLIEKGGIDDRIKLLDFGIAKQIQPSEDSQNLTASGQVFGSPLYMSPEQCMGGKLDARADIYSLGCVMYEVLCGRPPLIGKSPIETMQMHVHNDAKPFREINQKLEIPRQLESVVLQALKRDVSQRFQSVSAMLSELNFVQALVNSSQENPADLSGSAAIKAAAAQKYAGFTQAQKDDKEGNLSEDGNVLSFVPPSSDSSIGQFAPSEGSLSKDIEHSAKASRGSESDITGSTAGGASSFSSSTFSPLQIPSARDAMREVLGSTEQNEAIKLNGPGKRVDPDFAAAPLKSDRAVRGDSPAQRTVHDAQPEDNDSAVLDASERRNNPLSSSSKYVPQSQKKAGAVNSSLPESSQAKAARVAKSQKEDDIKRIALIVFVLLFIAAIVAVVAGLLLHGQ